MKLQKNKMLGGGGVDRLLSTSNNNQQRNLSAKVQKRNNIINSTVLFLSWLFVVIFSIFVLCSINANNTSIHKLNTINNTMAVGSTPDDSGTAKGFAGGNGEENNPYRIETPMQLRLLSADSSYWDKSFIQTADITYKTGKWNPIGNYDTKFTGNYDGKGHKITFENSISISEEFGGLFGYVQGASLTNKARIQNIGVDWQNGLTVEGSFPYAGGIVGYAEYTAISNCYNIGEIYATSYSTAYAGGIVCDAVNSTISSCYNMGYVHANGQDYAGAGGIADSCDDVINCYNFGKVYARAFATNAPMADAGAGGIVVYGSCSNCYNTGVVSASASTMDQFGSTTRSCGAIVSSSSATASNCYYLSGCATNPTNNSGSGENSADLKYDSTFNGWDFTNIWGINSGHNSGYPYLKAVDEYSVTYKAGEGSGSDKLIYYGLKTASPQAPITNATAIEIGFKEPSGKVFDCWMDESGNKYYVGNEPITLTSNLVLTAQWKVPYIDFTITLNANGGTLGSVTQIVVTQSVPQIDTPLTSDELPTRNGYTFNGFYTRTTGGERYIDSNGTVVMDANQYLTEIPTLYAQWVANTYTIVFNSNGGQGQAMQSMSMTYDEPLKLTKNTYSRDDYTFIGWATLEGKADSGQVDYNDEELVNMVTENNAIITLYAVWQSNYVDVTFEITTNVAVIFNVYDNSGNFVQQMFVDKNSNEQTVTTKLLKGKTYIIKLSTTYLANITNVNGGNLNGRELTIEVSESGSTVTMEITGYLGGNSIVV